MMTLTKTRLAEFNIRLAQKKYKELQELQQMVALIESNAGEDVKKYATLSAVKNSSQKQGLWQQHHLRFMKMSEQLRATFKKEYVEGELYLKAEQLEAQLVAVHNERENIIEINSINPGPRLKEAETEFIKTLSTVKEVLTRELSAVATEQSPQTPAASLPVGTTQ